MSSKKLFFAISFSFGLAILATVLANNWISSKSNIETPSNIDTHPVIVAAIQIPYGDTIEAHHVRIQEMPTEYLPEGYLSEVSQVEGTVSKRDLIKGEVILKHHFVEKQNGNVLASLLEKNMRAVTVRVNDVVGVGGFLMPGNYVDILSAKRVERGNVRISTVLQRIKVLAVDQQANADESNNPTVVRSVTLGVTPKQAETLVKAKSEGEIQLSLRNPSEDIEEKILADTTKKPEVKRRVTYPARQSNTQNIEIIRGLDTEQKKVAL